MTDEERKARMKPYFGKTADIKIDRSAGYVHEKDGDEDRLIAFFVGVNFTEYMIRRSFAAHEPCPDTDIEVYDIRFCECTAHRCRIEGLPDGFLDDCADKVIVYLSGHNFKLYTKREF